MLWGTLDNLDMNTSRPVLTVRPDSPALQAILIFEDAPLIYFRNYGWGTLDNLDMNTSHPVLTVLPDSPAVTWSTCTSATRASRRQMCALGCSYFVAYTSRE